MKRLFEMKLRDPAMTSKRIRAAFIEMNHVSCDYLHAVQPNSYGSWSGEPGPRPDGDEDLGLLECLSSFVLNAILNHKIVKSGKHPFDDLPDSREYDGCDGPYCGDFERPKEWSQS